MAKMPITALIAVAVMLGQPAPATVIAVHSGHAVTLAGGEPERLWGIESPIGTANGAEAARIALQTMASKPGVRFERRGAGLVLYSATGEMLNYQLVADGFVRHSLGSSDPEFRRFEAAQKVAQFSGRGIWGAHTTSAEEVASLANAEKRSTAPPTVSATGPGQAGRTLPEVTYSSQDNTLKATVQARVTETNTTWSRFSWRIVFQNSGSTPRKVIASVEFQDADGFPVDASAPEPATVPAHDEQTTTGFTLIRASVAPTVAKVIAKISQ